MLDRLRKACEQQDCEAARGLLLEGVAGYSPTEQVEDLVWREKARKAAADDSESAGNVTRLEPRRVPVLHEKGSR
jgi:hypothetical protein